MIQKILSFLRALFTRASKKSKHISYKEDFAKLKAMIENDPTSSRYENIWAANDPMLPDRVRLHNEARRNRINSYRAPGEANPKGIVWNDMFEGASRPFTVGDLVEWRSQSNGHWKDKWGRVVGIVPAGVNRDEVIKTLPGRGNYAYDKLGNGDARKQESYLVEASFGNKTFLYHPIAKHLRHTYTY